MNAVLENDPLRRDFIACLVADGTLSPARADRIASALSNSDNPFDVVVTELGFLTDKDLCQKMGVFLKLETVAAIDPKWRVFVDPPAKLEAFEFMGALPVCEIADGVQVLTPDPFIPETIELLHYHQERPIHCSLVTRALFNETIARLRRLGESAREASAATSHEQEDMTRLRDIASTAPVIRLVSALIDKALDLEATDIHFEPQDEALRVRVRLEGRLVALENLPKTMQAGIITRIKILASLNISERRIPQDGRMRVAVRGREVDFRVSALPGIHGETLVLRVLEKSTSALEIGALGFDADARETLGQLLRSPNGMVLVCGPTGSGKTTTLYALLKQLDTNATKICTVEDPIEYRMQGVSQTQIDTAIDLTFAKALRSILRQDPDTILVGEIRDAETAKIAVQAALTGHLLLSTVHANDAAGAITRLLDMGIDGYLVAATLRGVVSQRLVRKHCQACGGSGEMEPGIACSQCGGTGLKGRTVTYEIARVSAAVAREISAGADDAQLRTLLVHEGMVPLETHARSLVQSRVTSRSEIASLFEIGE